YRPGTSGGWRQTRGGSTRESSPRDGGGRARASGAPGGGLGGGAGDPSAGRLVMPGEHFGPERSAGAGLSVRPEERPFVAGDIADRGPLERGAAATTAEDRARDARERERQKAWRDQAAKAIDALKADEGTGPVNAGELAAAADAALAGGAPPPVDLDADEPEEADEPDEAGATVLHVENAGT